MSKYSVTITGTIDLDDPELSYLKNNNTVLSTSNDIVKYLTDILAEELALETTEIRVKECKSKMPQKETIFK